MRCLCCGKLMNEQQLSLDEKNSQWHKRCIKKFFGTEKMPILDLTNQQLEELASKTESLKCFIDPDAPEFVPQGNIPKRIQEYCIKTNQPVPKKVPEIVRCINESLALKYRKALEEIDE